MARTTSRDRDWLIILIEPLYCRRTAVHGDLRLYVWGEYRSEAEALRALTHSVLYIYKSEHKAYYVHRSVYERMLPFYQRKEASHVKTLTGV